ncbi:hypothetical protein LPJ53_006561, partial [Coemansia erecta]
GFWESVNKVGKICLPRRSGKTYNLTQMLLFFSILPEAKKLTDIPDSALVNNGASVGQVDRMCLAEKCRAKREQLFSSSLLKSNHPEFYKEHFMKYPVISISFAQCMGKTFIKLIYDIPFVTIDVANWDIDTKNHARGILKELYTNMFK